MLEATVEGLPDYIAVALDYTVVDLIDRRTYTKHTLTYYSLYAYVQKYGKFEPEDYAEYKSKGQITRVGPMQVRSEL